MDSTYSSLTQRKIIISGYFRGIPLCPIYGFGGILLLHTFAFLSSAPAWLTIVTVTILVTILEYIGGWISEHLLEEKLWDYSDQPLNLEGYISAWQSFLWLIVVIVAYLPLGHRAGIYINWLDSYLTINPNLQVVINFLIISFAFWATIRNKKLRLAKIAKETKQIFSPKNIKKLQKKIEDRLSIP